MISTETKKRFNELVQSRKMAIQSIQIERNFIAEKQDRIQHLEEAYSILQSIAENIQQTVHLQISNLVSRCLQDIFEEKAYEFRIDFVKRNNKTEGKIVLSKNGDEFDYKREIGGGVLDVISFALRVAALLLKKPQVSKILILDEPFKNIRGARHRSKVRDLIESLSDELGIQFIINIDTDAYPEFELGKVVRIGK